MPEYEWYTLDSSFQKEAVIEGYISFIWTERYSAYGDFTIVTNSTFQNRQLLAVDTWIGKKDSEYIMKVETVEDDTADDGSRTITVTGSSMEKLLSDRVAMPSLSDTTTVPDWVLTGTPGDIARSMFKSICVDTVLDPLDTIPFFGSSSLSGGIVPGYGIYWGCWTTHGIEARETLIGRKYAIQHHYYGWTSAFPGSLPEEDWDNGRLSLITWQPAGVNNSQLSVNELADIAAGVFDSTIDARAADVAAWGHPVFIRFGHEMNGTWYPWSGVFNPTNQLTGQNTNFDAGTGNWTGAGNCTNYHASTPHTGSGSLGMISQAAGNMDVGSCTTANILTQGMAVTPGDVVSVTAWSHAASVARSVVVGALFYNSSGTSIGGTIVGSAITNSTTEWTQHYAQVTAPSGAAWCRAVVRVQGTAASGETHHVDDVLMGLASSGPTNYVAAYQRVVDRFRAAGASNAIWVWSPNVNAVPNDAWNDFSAYYPGSDYVDWVGIDGYNWGTTTGAGWQTFATIFNDPGGVYQTYQAAKPIMICEVSSVEAGGDKASWITDALATIKTMPGLKAVLWFDAQTNFPIDTSPEALSAYIADVLDPYTQTYYSAGGTIPEPSDVITVTAQPDTLYNSLKSLCDTYNLGFKLNRNDVLGTIYFEVYTGNDLTADQSNFPAVIFDPDMESLSKVSQLTSTATVKTVAYVLATNGYAVVYAPGTDATVSGSDRRVLLINSSNTTAAGPDLDTALQQEGIMALAQQRPVYTFDGELPQTLSYVYGQDYNLGDLVEERNSDGYGNLMLVTEQIFSSDDTGYKAYPTLAVYQTVTPGSWLAEGSVEWSELDPSLTWATI